MSLPIRMLKNFLIADDHQLFLDGLQLILTEMDDCRLLASFSSSKKLLDKLVLYPHANMIMLDILMSGGEGMQTLQQIHQRYPGLRLLVLTAEDTVEQVREALQAGASAYVLKSTGKAELQMAIEHVSAGEVYLSQSIGQRLAQHMLGYSEHKAGHQHQVSLTEREEEILRMIAWENSNQQIAEQLFISPKTVETHRKNLMKKIGARNSLGIYKYALKHQWV
ncbi:response regulator transcription factor [Porifericola rhodea]|uniref:LuxR C-terminal-related transcriptional regulator n=1 Tax=Porifericola rhodea TaxID=930972 RepID=UPI0026658409|nr:response regulator transcription factor [Porifericola rhodea]WKN33861.1 response regulator transcription factor [Porifericola rhodea]